LQSLEEVAKERREAGCGRAGASRGRICSVGEREHNLASNSTVGVTSGVDVEVQALILQILFL